MKTKINWKNKEEVRKYHREYNQKNKEKKRKYAKEYWANHVEEHRKSRKKWREKFPEKHHKYNREYRKKNMEYYNEYQKKYAKKNNKKMKARIGAWSKIKLEPFCEICNGINKLERYHPNYNEPYKITTLCMNCHKQLHKLLGDLKKL